MDAEEPGDVRCRAACVQHGEDLGLLLGRELGLPAAAAALGLGRVSSAPVRRAAKRKQYVVRVHAQRLLQIPFAEEYRPIFSGKLLILIQSELGRRHLFKGGPKFRRVRRSKLRLEHRLCPPPQSLRFSELHTSRLRQPKLPTPSVTAYCQHHQPRRF